MTKQTYRLPQWPTQSTWAQVGLVDSCSTCSTRLQLRSPDWFNAIYMSIRFQVHDDRRFSIEANVSDLHHANVSDMTSLLASLKHLQRAVDKAKDDLATNYVAESDLVWFLTCLCKRMGLTEVVEYRPYSPDNVRPIVTDDLRRIADQLGRLTAFRA